MSTGQEFWKIIHFNEQGLIPAVIQDERSGRVLTLCYLNKEALKKSLEEWTVYVFRRSQNRVMLKGETSGHIQIIRRIEVDCEGKSLLFHVKQERAACHAGYFSCYHRRLASGETLEPSESPVFDPKQVYQHDHPTE
jgi:phosphoribosyl-AMP cyclohydrolase